MKIIFKGIVQGVGFRPTVYRIAQEMGLKGYVLNKGSEVEIVIDKEVDEFIDRVKKRLPATAKITDIVVEEDDRRFDDFRILRSENGERRSPIPVDIGICDECLKEIFDPKNRRYSYPFTNCTLCGARFSLIKDVPYDRERTSMDEFPLCEKCGEEYTNPSNRRYNAQTISCPKCGPSYKLYDKEKRDMGKYAIERFAKYIDKGAIGIIKSWGGMHLCCTLSQTKKFREWYGRPQKAFAVMVRDLASAEKYAKITMEEKELLLSNKRPIVSVHKYNEDIEDISPGLPTIGIYLPYTGLHHLLFHYMNADALIMTSANFHGEPMFINNKDVFSLGADWYLLHNRSIPNRIDDSVVKVWKEKKFFIRKSRGYVPEPLEVNYKKSILSVGAEENVCGAFSSNKKLYATQYIGNTAYYPTLEFLREALQHIRKLIGTEKIDGIAMDLHPGYSTRRVAEKFAEEHKARLIEVQHHWAHAASLLLDNKLDEGIVLALDGLGYGSDGNLWGGEVLYASFDKFERLGHLANIPLLGGDRATKDPRRLVFAIFKQFGKEKYFKEKEAEVLSKLMEKSPLTSSLGRVLDALSCYLDICEQRTYEGEPAMKLEKYLENGRARYKLNAEIKDGVVDTVELFRQLDEKDTRDLSEREKADLAYSIVKKIMEKLSEIAIDYAEERKIKNIGITGGVSYNIPITEMVEKEVKKSGFNFITHDRVPNGDGGIAIGQNAIAGTLLS